MALDTFQIFWDLGKFPALNILQSMEKGRRVVDRLSSGGNGKKIESDRKELRLHTLEQRTTC